MLPVLPMRINPLPSSSLQFSPVLSRSLFWSAGPYSPSGSHKDRPQTLCSRSKVTSLHKLVVCYKLRFKWPSANRREDLEKRTKNQASKQQKNKVSLRKNADKYRCCDFWTFE